MANRYPRCATRKRHPQPAESRVSVDRNFNRTTWSSGRLARRGVVDEAFVGWAGGRPALNLGHCGRESLRSGRAAKRDRGSLRQEARPRCGTKPGPLPVLALVEVEAGAGWGCQPSRVRTRPPGPRAGTARRSHGGRSDGVRPGGGSPFAFPILVGARGRSLIAAFPGSTSGRNPIPHFQRPTFQQLAGYERRSLACPSIRSSRRPTSRGSLKRHWWPARNGFRFLLTLWPCIAQSPDRAGRRAARIIRCDNPRVVASSDLHPLRYGLKKRWLAEVRRPTAIAWVRVPRATVEQAVECKRLHGCVRQERKLVNRLRLGSRRLPVVVKSPSLRAIAPALPDAASMSRTKAAVLRLA